MVLRVKSQNHAFKIVSLILVSLYTAFWLAWLIWCLVLRFRFIGKECCGDFMGISNLTSPEVRDNYTVMQGHLTIWLLIGVVISNSAITVIYITVSKISQKLIK